MLNRMVAESGSQHMVLTDGSDVCMAKGLFVFNAGSSRAAALRDEGWTA